MEAPLIYPDVLQPPAALGQDSPSAAGLSFWVQSYTFYSSQVEEKSREAMVLATFHWSHVLTLSNFPAIQERNRPTPHALGHHMLPVTRLQLTRRSQGQRWSLLLWTTSTAWLCLTWALPLVDQGAPVPGDTRWGVSAAPTVFPRMGKSQSLTCTCICILNA